MPEILIATGNAGKAREFSQMLPEGWILKTLKDLPPEIGTAVEDGATFEENALKKARHIAPHFQGWVLADDSGLEVDALDLRPGVYSARYAGEGAGDRANLEKLLEELREIPDNRRQARFRCVLALIDPQGREATFAGACEGRILKKASGEGGFGYDPVFAPSGFDRTFGELGSEVKHGLSHRGQAFGKVVSYLGKNGVETAIRAGE